MSNWIDIGPHTDYPAGSRQCLRVEKTPVVVCHLDGKLTAFLDNCPHAGLPLGQGDLQGKVLVCPFHGYAFDVTCGRNIDTPTDEPLTMLPIQIHEQRVQIQTQPS